MKSCGIFLVVNLCFITVLERRQHIMCIYLLRFPRLYTTPLWRILCFHTHHIFNLYNSKYVVYPVYCTVWFYQECGSIIFCHMKKLLCRSTKGLDEYKFYLTNSVKLYINTQSESTYFLIEVDPCIVLTFNVCYVYFKLYIFVAFFW
jgi:hypothetical protein